MHEYLTGRWFVLAAVSSAAVIACSPDQDLPDAPAPGAKIHPTTVLPSERLTSIETDVVGPTGQPARVRCVTCHASVDVGEAARSPEGLEDFHRGLTLNHGELACGSCHEPGEPLSLRLATGQPIPITRAMDLCSQCHGPQRRSYENGAHGGMNGHWDLSRGERVKNQCVDCHDPHAPQIPAAHPVLPPIDRGEVAVREHVAPVQGEREHK